MINEQVLNDLKQAKQKVVSSSNNLISAKDIIVALSTVNLESYYLVSEYVYFNHFGINAKRWIELCDKAGI